MLCSQGHEHVLVLVIVPPSVNPEICWQIPSAESAALALGEGPYLVVALVLHTLPGPRPWPLPLALKIKQVGNYHLLLPGDLLLWDWTDYVVSGSGPKPLLLG